MIREKGGRGCGEKEKTSIKIRNRGKAQKESTITYFGWLVAGYVWRILRIAYGIDCSNPFLYR